MIAEALESLRRKGVYLWSQEGRLRYRAPKGALTGEELSRLKDFSAQIVALLEAETRLEPRREADLVPLTYSQKSHWNWYQLGRHPSLRQIASATRLCGRLNIDALRQSLAKMVVRHEALRTQISVEEGIRRQKITESDRYELETDDIRSFAEGVRAAEVQRQIEEFISIPIDVTADPLFGARLVRLGDEEHVLIVAMEHSISDARSMSIFMGDLFSAYVQLANDCALCLPPIGIQFADFAVWQERAQMSWLEKHGSYWEKRLAGCRRVKFPDDIGKGAGGRLGWSNVPVCIAPALAAELRVACRVRHTTIVMGVLTAYVALILRWCKVSDVVIEYVTDGRVSKQIEHTIGFFAFFLSLRVELLESDTFTDLMHRVTDEYCKAYEHADYGYIEAQTPRPEFVRNSAFSWIPNTSPADLPDQGIRCYPVPFEHPMLRRLERDSEPGIELLDRGDEIAGTVLFPSDRFSISTMERFANNFLLFVTALLRQPQARVKDVLLL